jgi:hypothetical protein
METRKVIEFEREGVTVTIPEEIADISVRSVPLGRLEDMPGIEGIFMPKRLVIQIEFFNQKEPERSLAAISGRAKIRVRYIPKDVENAGGDYKNIKMGFYWHDAWNVFTPEKHHYEILPNEKDPRNGFCLAELETWDDPPIGMDA